MGKAKTKRLRRQLPSERVPTALVAVTRLTMMLSVRSGLELQGEGKRETRSLELWSPAPKRALSPWWRSRSRDYGHFTYHTVEHRLRVQAGPMHTPRDKTGLFTAPCNGNALGNPA